MSEQNLDHADIDVLLQQMRCKAVPQRVRRHPLGDLRHVSRGVNGTVELTRGEMVDRVLSRKQPDLGPCDPPPVAQELEQLRREHGKAILAPLDLLDPQQHALAVNVADLQRRDLGDAQARTVGGTECSPVLRPWRRLQKARYLLGAQHDGDLPRLRDERQRLGDIDPVDRYAEEEAQRRDRAVDGWWAHAGAGQVQLEEPQVLGHGRVGRSAEEDGEVLNRADVVTLGLRGEVADGHILDHPLPQRADGLLGHRGLLS